METDKEGWRQTRRERKRRRQGCARTETASEGAGCRKIMMEKQNKSQRETDGEKSEKKMWSVFEEKRKTATETGSRK